MNILPILTTSLIHYSLKGWENVLFELVNERDVQERNSVLPWMASSVASPTASANGAAKKEKLDNTTQNHPGSSSCIHAVDGTRQ